MIQTIEHGPVRELRLDRPPANALSPELIVALRQAVEVAPREGARALVLSGAPRRFSGGLDVPLLLTLDRRAMDAVWRDFYGLLRALAASTVPIAAAITGHAPAGGTVLALFCDWRIVAAGDWAIGLNEVQVGLPLPPVIYRALQRLVGPRQAGRLALEGVLISPVEAASIGLVDEVVPPDQVVESAVAWCQKLLAVPQGALALTRREARAELVGFFGSDLSSELQEVSAAWWADETQRVLRGLVERLAQKKSSK
ncbi:MAG: enoyl-CoA hydratase/isomerase family protein [Acidobacteriia bacterium]|nr:enoyl-CoA hydratase/isomerase family protein [Terriglobia bacterium]